MPNITLEPGGSRPPTPTEQGYIRAAIGVAPGKHKLDATVAPSVTDDSDAGYGIGSQWVDVVANLCYWCVDATVGAAAWRVAGDSDALLWEVVGGDPNVPNEITVTGTLVGAYLDPIPVPTVLTRGADVGGVPAWEGDNSSNLQLHIGDMELQIGAGDYVAINTPPDPFNPVGQTYWTITSGTGQPTITGDAPQATHIGQWCRVTTAAADVYDWWQWNGEVWVFVRTDGETFDAATIAAAVSASPSLVAAALKPYTLSETPTSTFDASHGYAISDIVVDIYGDAYFCVDATDDAAVWVLILEPGLFMLRDANGLDSLEWNGRALVDSAGEISSIWESRELYYSDGSTPSVSWESANLADTAWNASLNWDQRQLYDNVGGNVVAMDWNVRQLFADDGITAVLDWSDPAQLSVNTLLYADNFESGDTVDAVNGFTSIGGSAIFNFGLHAVLNAYADDAAAAADSGLYSGGFYTITGSTVVHRKP